MSAACTALIGFSVPAIEAVQRLGRDYVVVVPPGFGPYMEEHSLPYIEWDFESSNEQSIRLASMLQERGAELAVPLYEETVEWAGTLNGIFRDDPRLFSRYLLFRDKAMMKRRAQLGGIRVGVFEEADNVIEVHRFFNRINNALHRRDDDQRAPVHLKPLSSAGCYGHKFLRSTEQIDALTDDDFPSLLESHLDGQEFSCEVFIHRGKIRYLNITEYVRLGHSNFVPAGPELERKRPVIRKAVEDLIEAFEIEYGMIHPEFFITPDDKVNFGEVAARVPGGHIFDLIHKACGFDPFAGLILCSDPETSVEALDAFFPDESQHDGYAGCVMVYPRHPVVKAIAVPDGLVDDPYYEKHHLFMPVNQKMGERVAYGDHLGTVYFRGGKPERMRELLKHYDEVDFYLPDVPSAAPEAASEVPEVAG